MADQSKGPRGGGPATASRREFLRNAAAGVAGAAVMAGGGLPAAAESKKPGEVTLDAILTTYYGAPIGGRLGAKYTPGRAYDTTLSMAATAAPDLRLRPSVPAGKERFFAGVPYTQRESEAVRRALTVAQRFRPGESESFGTLPTTGDDGTVFVG